MTNKRLRFQTLFLAEVMIPWEEQRAKLCSEVHSEMGDGCKTEEFVKKVLRCLPFLVTSLDF